MATKLKQYRTFLAHRIASQKDKVYTVISTISIKIPNAQMHNRKVDSKLQDMNKFTKDAAHPSATGRQRGRHHYEVVVR